MKSLVLALSVALAFMLLFGCAGQQPAAPAPAPTAPVQGPAKEVAKPAEPVAPSLQPIHLSYLFSTGGTGNGPEQRVNFDYYLDELTTCGGRPALNGFMAASQQGQPGASYLKTTVYLDTGEAVYSDNLNGPDIAFDNALPKMADFDFAFSLQTLAARGGKKFLSDEVWNATKPVLLKNVAAFGGIGDYSVTAGGIDRVAGLECKTFTVSTKTSSMEGQIVFCVHQLGDVPLSFVTSGTFPGQGSINWQLTGMTREKPTTAYYPQCLAPVSCPSLGKPAQSEYDACQSQGNSLEPEKDASNCVTAFRCLTQAERARKQLAGSQRPGCPVNEQFVQQLASCWGQGGNANFQNNQQTGCIESVECSASQ